MSLGDTLLALQLLEGLATLKRVDENVRSLVAGQSRMEASMATVREVLAQLTTDVDGIEEDITRTLAEVQRLLDVISSGDVELSAELQAAVDAQRAKLAVLNAAMDDKVPPASPEEPEAPAE
jgi:septal ring factor EnvC (AmiA/AmiB activator)